MNIAVYLGSAMGNNEEIQKETEELGKRIGENNFTLIYGGSNTGLMNILASSTKKNGGKVIGVEIPLFHNRGYSFSHCDEFILSKDLSERKKTMMEKADAFIALPGGIGTLDEISEVMCLDSLSENKKPIFFLNTDGFYNDLKKQFEKMVAFNFLKKEYLDTIYFADDVTKLFDRLLENKSLFQK